MWGNHRTSWQRRLRDLDRPGWRSSSRNSHIVLEAQGPKIPEVPTNNTFPLGIDQHLGFQIKTYGTRV